MDINKVSKYFRPTRILDIGANIGQFHLLCNKEFPQSYVFSIEASEECEPFLKQITDQYFIGLLSDTQNEHLFYKNDDPISTGDSVYKERTIFYSDEKIKTVTKKGHLLDELFSPEEYFDLIKIDTQGSELDIIKGGLNLVQKAKGLILEVSIEPYNEGAPTYDEVIQFMQNLGWQKTEVLAHIKVPQMGLDQEDIFFYKHIKEN